MSEKDVIDNYDDYWKELVENKDGTLNKEEIKKYLSDYSWIMENTTRVFMEVSGGMISYPNTLASEVIGVYEERQESLFEQWAKDNDLIEKETK